MNKILAVTFAIFLAGCGTVDGAHVARSLAYGVANAARSQTVQQSSNPVAQQVQQYGTLQPAKQSDHVCVSRCVSAGYQYGLCQSKCSY